MFQTTHRCPFTGEQALTRVTHPLNGQLRASLVHMPHVLRPKCFAYLQGPHKAGDLGHARQEDEDGIGLTAGSFMRGYHMGDKCLQELIVDEALVHILERAGCGLAVHLVCGHYITIAA